jgi:N-acetyl-anhydromuramyl-L-alanine amidase AmpD
MKYKDVSAHTSLHVGGIRTVKRKLIVLHTTMGYNSLAWLQGGSHLAGTPASCDYLITRIGDIYQLSVPGRYAYHSGTARWLYVQDSDYTVNQSAVGIEWECAEHRGQKITDLQYIAGAALIRRLFEYHDLQVDKLVTHGGVALPPGRKKDPIYLDMFVLTREMAFPSLWSKGLIFPQVMP